MTTSPPRKPPKVPKWLAAARAAGAERTESHRDWIARALARAGVLSPAEVASAIDARRIRLGDQFVTDGFAPVLPGVPVFVDGAQVSLAAQTRVLAFNKPEGVVTAGSDPEGRGTVFDVLHRALKEEHRHFGWHALGRLDRNTTGLLLFTNDERLVDHVTKPEAHLPKRYVAHVNGGATDQKLEPLRSGITLEDGPTRPAVARLHSAGIVELTLTEGRRHQVKRMLAAVGLPVTKLHREAIGAIRCDTAAGDYRTLSAEEIREGLRFAPLPVGEQGAPGSNTDG